MRFLVVRTSLVDRATRFTCSCLLRPLDTVPISRRPWTSRSAIKMCCMATGTASCWSTWPPTRPSFRTALPGSGSTMKLLLFRWPDVCCLITSPTSRRCGSTSLPSCCRLAPTAARWFLCWYRAQTASASRWQRRGWWTPTRLPSGAQTAWASWSFAARPTTRGPFTNGWCVSGRLLLRKVTMAARV